MLNSCNKVIWAEGMFLGQQHFQQWDDFIEQQQRQRVQALRPFAWGLQSLSIDESALLNGQFRVKHCQAIFPSGHLVTYEAGNDKDLFYQLTRDEAEITDIYLCLPTVEGIDEIAGYEKSRERTKWVACYQQVADHFDRQRQREVLFARPNLFITTQIPVEKSCEFLKIAQINSPKFIPTCLYVKASNYLNALVNKIIDILIEKIRAIKKILQQMQMVSQFHDKTSLECFFLVRSLQLNLQVFRHVQDHPQVHPEKLYILLVKLSSDLSLFDHADENREIPRYQHENMTDTFGILVKLVLARLDKAIPKTSIPLKIRREHEHLYVVEILNSQIFNTAHFYLAVQFHEGNPQWVVQFARHVKVGPLKSINSIVASAMRGVNVMHVLRPPSKLIVKPGCEYFYVEPMGDFWRQIKEEKHIGIFIPNEYIGMQLDVVAVED